MIKAINNFADTFSKLFIKYEKHGVHRLTGLAYLIMYFASVYLIMYDWDLYKRSQLCWIMPLTGWCQALIAAGSFKTLPLGNTAQGYYSDKRTITKAFMLENIYFSGILLFQCVYAFTNFFNNIPFVLELVMVFLPYTLIRRWFPKTSLGSSRDIDSQYSGKNKNFLKFIALLSKVFYVWAKHYNGYYLNYLMFLGILNPLDGSPQSEKYLWMMHALLVADGWATTPAMFLHTLKFKKYIGPKTALSLYAGTFPIIVATLSMIQYQMGMAHAWVSLIVLLGVPINFLPPKYQAQHIYQFCVMGYMLHLKGYF